MAQWRRRSTPLTLAALLALLTGSSLRLRPAAWLFAGTPKRVCGGQSGVARRAEEGEASRSTALVKVGADIETKLAAAEEAKDDKKTTQLARLLTLVKASEGAAAWQATKELSTTVGDELAATLADFVGKEEYDIKDVASEVEKRLDAAVSQVDNVYLSEEEAKKDGATDPIIVKDLVAPVVDNVKESTEGAVTAFAEGAVLVAGDISKEADKQAKKAIGEILGKEEYDFDDVSKFAAEKAMEGVTSFTGKENYEFGDISKTIAAKAQEMFKDAQKAQESPDTKK